MKIEQLNDLGDWQQYIVDLSNEKYIVLLDHGKVKVVYLIYHSEPDDTGIVECGRLAQSITSRGYIVTVGLLAKRGVLA